jgi:hypothetical protein
MKKIFAIAAIMALAVLAVPLSAEASGGPLDGRIVLGSDYTLESGDILEGDLLVFGGNVTIEKDAVVEGSIFVLGGNTSISGEVQGDMAVLGGNVDLERPSVIRGDLFTLGGNLDRHTGSTVEGNITSDFGLKIDAPVPGFPQGIQIPSRIVNVSISPFARVGWLLFRTIVIAALAVLVVMFWPTGAQRAAEVIASQPILTGGIGLLTLVVSPILILLLLITIILIPLGLLVPLLIVVAALFGWTALGLEVGKRLASAANWGLHDAAAAGIGTLLLSLVVGAFALLPCCISWPVQVVAISLGLGAVVLTRFGTQSYGLPAAPAAPPAKPEEKPKRRAPRKVASK